MLEASETPHADGTSLPEEPDRLPIFQEASQLDLSSRSELASPERTHLPQFQEVLRHASPFEIQPIPLHLSQQAPSTRPWPDSSLQPQRRSHGVIPGPLFQPYQARLEPNALEEVRIPGRTELDVIENIHNRPLPTSNDILYDFCRAYDVPLDIPSGLRAQSILEVYPKRTHLPQLSQSSNNSA